MVGKLVTINEMFVLGERYGASSHYNYRRA